MPKTGTHATWFRFVAANTKRLRLKQDLTQEVLAEKAGLDVRYIQEIERANTNVTLAVLVDVATALGIHPRVLLNQAELQPAKPGRPRKRRKSPK